MNAQNWLYLHFLNVDHGACTILQHPNDHRKNGEGRISFVDINDWKHLKDEEAEELVAGLDYYLDQAASTFMSQEEYADQYLDDPIEYYESHYSGLKTNVWRFIPTHPDMDHLSGLKRLDGEIGFDVMWDTEHEKEQDLDDWDERFDREDWLLYEEIREGDTDHSVIKPTMGSQADYYQQDNIEILHPTSNFISDLNDQEDPNWNNASYVLKVSNGNQAILLPGDAEEDAWDKILDIHGTEGLSDVTILNAAHHGRMSGFHREAVEAMDPNYVILSVGKKPDTDAHDLYRDACSDDTEILSTRQYGTIRFRVTRRRASLDLTYPDGIFDLPDQTEAWA